MLLFQKLKEYVSQKKAAATKQKTLTPIVSSAILKRVKIDLINYCNKPDHNYHYLLHIKDYFSKYTALYIRISLFG